MIYVRFLRSLLRHKWFVFLAGRRVGVSLWQLLIHDWSKFTPLEFITYARYFYGDYPRRCDIHGDMRYMISDRYTAEGIKARFDLAWLHHQKCNRHHWQYWVLINDSDDPQVAPLPMPERYVREMVADWHGAGRAYSDSWNIAGWLSKNASKMRFHRITVERIHDTMLDLGYVLTDNYNWSFDWVRSGNPIERRTQ